MRAPQPDSQSAPSRTSERRLLEQIARGDPTAWRSFLDAYLNLIYGCVYSALRQHPWCNAETEAADVVQDLFAQLMANNGKRLLSYQGRDGASLAGWLRVVVTRHAFRYLRGRKAMANIEDVPEPSLPPSREADSARKQVEDREQLDLLDQAVERLAPREQLIYRLYYRDERPGKEIAAILGLEPNHVDQLLYRIRQRLQKALQDCKEP